MIKYLVLSRTRQILVDKMILASRRYQVFEENSAKVLFNSKLYCLRTGSHLIHSNYGIRGSDWYIEKMVFEGALEMR